MRTLSTVVGLAAAVVVAGPALAQQSVTVDLAGVEVRHGRDQARSSVPGMLAPAARYRYEISGTVRGQPALSALWFLFNEPVPLEEALESLVDGSSAFLTGVVANPDLEHPFTLTDEEVSGSQMIGSTNAVFSATISAGIDASDVAFFSISDVTITPSAIGYLQFVSGSVVITRIPCPANFDEGGVPGSVTSSDISAFLTAWLADLNSGGRETDYNLDGVVNSADISAFLTDWLATVTNGCPE